MARYNSRDNGASPEWKRRHTRRRRRRKKRYGMQMGGRVRKNGGNGISTPNMLKRCMNYSTTPPMFTGSCHASCDGGFCGYGQGLSTLAKGGKVGRRKMTTGGRTGRNRNCGQNQNPAQCNGLPSCEWCSNMGRRGTCVTAGHCGIQQTGLDYYWEDPGVMGGMVNCIQNPNHPSCRGANSQYQRGGSLNRRGRRNPDCMPPTCPCDGGGCLTNCCNPPTVTSEYGGGYNPYPNHPAAQNAAMPGTGKTGYNFELFSDVTDCIRSFGSQSEGGAKPLLLGMCYDYIIMTA